MTPDKKRVQIIKLDMDLFHMRMVFNRKFSALRQEKSNGCCEIALLNNQLQAINESMGIKGDYLLLRTKPSHQIFITACVLTVEQSVQKTDLLSYLDLHTENP